MGVLDNAIMIGREATYGAGATLARAYEGVDDTFMVKRDRIPSVGMRGGSHTTRSDRNVIIDMGGEGVLKFDILDKGFMLLGQALLGSVTGPIQVAATTAYETTIATTTVDPADSFAVQLLRFDATDPVPLARAFTHLGGVISSWEIGHTLTTNLNTSLSFNSQTVSTGVAAGTPVYPTDARPYDWTQAAFTINGGSFRCVTDFKMGNNLALKTDRRCMRQSALMKRPTRIGLPALTGELKVEWIGDDLYDLYRAGTSVPIVGSYVGREIESGQNYELEITLASCLILEDATPHVTLSDIPMQTIPFEIQHDGVNPAISIRYKSTDTAL